MSARQADHGMHCVCVTCNFAGLDRDEDQLQSLLAGRR